MDEIIGHSVSVTSFFPLQIIESTGNSLPPYIPLYLGGNPGGLAPIDHTAISTVAGSVWNLDYQYGRMYFHSAGGIQWWWKGFGWKHRVSIEASWLALYWLDIQLHIPHCTPFIFVVVPVSSLPDIAMPGIRITIIDQFIMATWRWVPESQY